jgi:pimeloyl-ACP methyl ester carboxylesterase
MYRYAALLCALGLPVFGGVDADSLSLTLELKTATVGGVLLLPRASRPFPCVVLAGGTLSQLRDGELDRQGVPKRTALKRLAESLAGAGYGSFRYDQVGHGSSRPKPGWKDLYSGDAEVLAEIYAYLRGRSECTKVVAAGESAGAYVASLAARAGAHADAYLFLGGFCGKAEEIFSYNFGRLAEYVEKAPEHLAWARTSRLDRDLAFGRRWREMFAAARAGKDSFEVIDGAFRQTVSLARRREELENPPDEMFAYVKSPALALAGTRDLNVAPHHAACAVAVMQRAGNLRSKAVLIEGADHNFQVAADDADLAFRERYTFASFHRPYHPDLDRVMLEWLKEVAPAHGDASSLAVHGSMIEPRTSASPERLHLAPGVTIIDDILDRRKTAGVDTLEGFIGPLLRTPEMRAHFIDMPAGLYLNEHPHAKGSIIYTVRGRWGLSSLGRWRLMKPGSLYWFGDNIPTGFQVPFPEGAFILIFKAVSGDDDEAFVRYLQGMAANLKKEREAGTVFRLTDLAPSHPARDFARRVNPHFERDFPSRRKIANRLPH